MTNKDLKPCPFCGGEADVIGHYGDATFTVVCWNRAICGMRVETLHLTNSPEEAAAVWNRRAGDAEERLSDSDSEIIL